MVTSAPPLSGLARSPAPGVSSRASAWFLGASAIAFLLAAAGLYTRFVSFDAVLRVAIQLLSGSGTISPEHRAAFGRLWVSASALAAIVGVVLVILSNPSTRRRVDGALRWDAMHVWGLATPNPYLVLSLASLVGLLTPVMWMERYYLGPFVIYLFRKEGPFEDVTFVLELAGAAVCFAAAWCWHVREPRDARFARLLYAALGAVLFLVGMEEINWGQTLFGFATPDAWSRINYQHETSLHNLADHEVLDVATKAIAVGFGVGMLALVALSWRFPRSLIGAIAPHPALIPLGLSAAYSGARLHPELIELLLSVFFAFYSYRIWRAARSSMGMHPETDCA